MDKKGIVMSRAIIITVVVAVLGIGGIVVVASQNKSATNPEGMSTMSMESKNSSSSKQATVMDSDQTSKAEVSVDIKDYEFVPAKLKIKKGTKVTWTNQDVAKHNVVVPEGPTGGLPTTAQVFGKGQSFTFTFNEVGSFSYICSPHPYMKASVEVVE